MLYLSYFLAVEPTDSKIVITHDPEPVSSLPDSYLFPEALLNGILPPPVLSVGWTHPKRFPHQYSLHTHTFYPQADRISRPPKPTFHYPNSRGHGPFTNSVVMQTSELSFFIFLNLNILISTLLSFYDTHVQ